MALVGERATRSSDVRTGIVIATYLAEPGTPSADALVLLRSWSAQPEGSSIRSKAE